MITNIIKLSVSKLRELRWTLIFALLLVFGFIFSTLTPYIINYLEVSTYTYLSSTVTYVIIKPGQGQGGQLLPKEILPEIRSIKGVKDVYPIYIFTTTLVLKNVTGYFSRVINYDSVVVGGDFGLPSTLLTIASGRLPQDNQYLLSVYNPITRCGSLFSAEIIVFNQQINASCSGEFDIPANLYLTNIDIIWNYTFIKKILDENKINITGYNAILLAVTIEDFSSVLNNLNSLLKNYTGYRILADESAVESARNLIAAQSSLLNTLILISYIIPVIVFVIVNYVFIRRRIWELGLFAAYPIRSRYIIIYFLTYYALIYFISIGIGLLITFLLSLTIHSISFKVFNTSVSISLVPDPSYFIISALVGLSIVLLTTIMLTVIYSRINVDKVLREY